MLKQEVAMPTVLFLNKAFDAFRLPNRTHSTPERHSGTKLADIIGAVLNGIYGDSLKFLSGDEINN
jgi:hypothetical protein